MSRAIFSLVVLFCAAHVTLSQDCATEHGQLQFLQEKAESDPECYNPLINSLLNEQDPSPEELSTVCQEECVGAVLDFLRSNETCRNDPEVVAIADILENIVCSFENGIGDPESSCLFYDLEDDADRFIGATIESCATWWILIGPSDSCPPLFSTTVTTTCRQILMQTYDEVSCCYVNYLRSEEIVNNITVTFNQELVKNGQQPNTSPDFRVDIADPDLLKACGITDGGRCPSSLLNQDETGTATMPVVTLLVVILLALLAAA